jgi:DNA polymerase III epsilon subunit-like protein
LLDTETTGFSNQDRIIQLAFRVLGGQIQNMDCDVKETSEEGEEQAPLESCPTFGPYLISPQGRKIHRKAKQAHGLTDLDVRDQASFWAIAHDFSRRVDSFNSKAVLFLSHNGPFDKRMLMAEFKKIGKPWPDHWEFACSLQMARALRPGLSCKLQNVHTQ